MAAVVCQFIPVVPSLHWDGASPGVLPASLFKLKIYQSIDSLKSRTYTATVVRVAYVVYMGHTIVK